MFETTLTASDSGALRAWSLPIAAFLHLGAALLLVGASLVTLGPVRDPEMPIDVRLWLTPAPPPPPPAPPSPPTQPASLPVLDRAPEELVQPTEMPTTLPAAPQAGDEEPLESAGNGSPDGVPGGLEIGVPGGFDAGSGSVLGIGPAGRSPQAAAEEPLAISGNVRAPVLVYRNVPVYPRMASITRIQGRVVLRAVIDEAGAVESVEVLAGHPLLADAAGRAVGRWRYWPATLDGRAVRVWIEVTVRFALE